MWEKKCQPYCNLAAPVAIMWECSFSSRAPRAKRLLAMFHAALLAAAARAWSQLTDTSFETPGSCMVTP